MGDLLPRPGQVPRDRKPRRRHPHPLRRPRRRDGGLDVVPRDAAARARARHGSEIDAELLRPPPDRRQRGRTVCRALVERAHDGRRRRRRFDGDLHRGERRGRRRRIPRLPGVADHDEQGVDLERLPLGCAVMEDHPGTRGGDLGHRLVGLHLDHRLVETDRCADGHEPPDDHGLDETLADVGKMELVRHQASRVRWTAATIRPTSGT